MKIKQMIRENNRLQDQMTPANLKYYEDIVIYIRTSAVDEACGEEALLKLGRQLLDAQQQGKQAEDIFGSDPAEYCAGIIETLPKQKLQSQLQVHLMIPWVALTWFFFAEALIGFITKWSGGDVEKVSQVRVSTLVLLAAGSYVLVKLIMNLINREAGQPEESRRKINVRSMGIYIAVTVVILAAGVWLGRALPVLVIPPWVSLVLFIAGLIGMKAFFFRR
ncbi:DUF1129 family protein [Paenibacillus dakarensis]|uniref:DUF1129 family protein n=1 Tax=Paenibacillus dakarensis TaxID=1527293 RepID=UPI0006D54D68|nr:DUF1129 family protein [Paenibacillus dakarensis]